MSSDASLAQLVEQYPLPPGWKLARRIEDTIDVSQPGLTLKLRRAGLIAQREGRSVGASAAGRDEDPLARAYFRLLERVVLVHTSDHKAPLVIRDAQGGALGTAESLEVFLEAPEGARYSYAKSHGVALGQDWADACALARAELLKRDALLRAWYGQTMPKQVGDCAHGFAAELAGLYEFESYELPALSEHVVFSVAFPKSPNAPLLLGLACGAAIHEASDAALSQCLEKLGFLWGEAIPEAEPRFSCSADYHQEYYLWPPKAQVLRDWLGGAHRDYAVGVPAPEPAEFTFADLGASGERRLAKGLSAACLPLTYGQGAALLNHKVLSELTPTLWVAPIP